MFRLQCKTQNYEWGKIGLLSAVAQLLKQQGLPVNDTLPYAELWAGDHPNGESTVILEPTKTELISLHLSQNREKALGPASAKWKNLPYLFKVLSINKALSIQAHPDKELAQQLHHARPSVYKDPNHKPELAIAITPMEALCGFRPHDQILTNLKATPELAAVLGTEVVENFARQLHSTTNDQKASLKALFAALINSNPETTTKHLNDLLTRIANSNELQDQIVRRVHSEFPGDAGVFCIYLFNLVFLKPGEGIFLGPNEPHAYLQGDCVECMARSDNVVRAGLTPKEIDSHTLINMLTYKMELPKIYKGDQILKTETCSISTYIVPTEEFFLTQCNLAANASVQREGVEGPRIVSFLAGKGSIQHQNQTMPYLPGTSVLLHSGSSFQVSAMEETQFFETACHCSER